jgi:transposase
VDTLLSELNYATEVKFMRKQSSKKTATRNHYPQGFRDEALALAQKVGVAQAAKDLGLNDSQLYGWRKKAQLQASRSQIEQDQAVEIARLKRKVSDQEEELAILKKAAAYFARGGLK